MSEHTAIVTGGLRGLGHAMALGLSREGCNVVAVGHIEADIAAMRDASAAGTASRLAEPEEMIAPLLFVVSREADAVNGFRFDANLWDTSLPPVEAARRVAQPSGFVLHPPRAWDA